MRTFHLILITLMIISTAAAGQPADSINQTDQQGQKHGLWIKKYPNGQIRYKGHFDHGQPVDTFKRYFPNGKPKAVMNHREERAVYTKLFNKQGQKQAEGLYVNRKKDSVWLFYNKKGQVVIQEQYEQGKRDGKSVKFFPDGDTSHVTTWQNGQKHGVYKQYFPNGRLKLLARYQHGELDGPFTIFTPNGYKDIEGDYSNNLRHGKWVYFKNRTDTAQIVRYKNGDPLNEEAMELKESKEILRLEQKKGKFGRPEEVVLPDRRRRRY